MSGDEEHVIPPLPFPNAADCKELAKNQVALRQGLIGLMKIALKSGVERKKNFTIQKLPHKDPGKTDWSQICENQDALRESLVNAVMAVKPETPARNLPQLPNSGSSKKTSVSSLSENQDSIKGCLSALLDALQPENEHIEIPDLEFPGKAATTCQEVSKNQAKLREGLLLVLHLFDAQQAIHSAEGQHKHNASVEQAAKKSSKGCCVIL
eukprot:gb/GEZN01012537.1/.p1 GENE.gb/GEZN01012537.1/~~gb/GEZN01012537.1/.p1  ORF type:complete len:210 (-),score=37.48 gb/GEZN01012537.1/:417-1046(-)